MRRTGLIGVLTLTIGYATLSTPANACTEAFRLQVIEFARESIIRGSELIDAQKKCSGIEEKLQQFEALVSARRVFEREMSRSCWFGAGLPTNTAEDEKRGQEFIADAKQRIVACAAKDIPNLPMPPLPDVTLPPELSSKK